MENKPFPNLDGRQERTRFLRESAIALLGGEESYDSASYMRRSLACRAATLSWMIDNDSLSVSELTQANNAYLGICNKIDRDAVAGHMPKIPKADVLSAMTEGVKSAIWDVASNSTDMPCNDFYEAIKAGVKSGVEGRNE